MSWNRRKALDTYGIPHWGGGYFDVSDSGHLLARPRRDDEVIDLHDLGRQLAAAGARLPVLVRFSGILHDRVDTLCGAFAHAMSAAGYQGGIYRRLSDQGQPAA